MSLSSSDVTPNCDQDSGKVAILFCIFQSPGREQRGAGRPVPARAGRDKSIMAFASDGASLLRAMKLNAVPNFDFECFLWVCSFAAC